MNEQPTFTDVIVIDRRLKGFGGHNLSYVLTVTDAFRKAGLAVSVYGHEAMEAALIQKGFHALFSDTDSATHLPPTLFHALRRIRNSAALFQADVRRGLGPALGRSNVLVFSPTLDIVDLVGWSNMCENLRCCLAVVMRVTPNYRSMAPWKVRLHPFHRIQPGALRRLHRRMGSRFLLTADSHQLITDFRTVYEGRAIDLPVPLDRHIGTITSAPRKANDPVRVGFLGEARTSKGFHLLPAVLEKVLLGRRQVSFLLQCPVPRGGEREGASLIAGLERLAIQYPGQLRLVPERLDQAAYAQLLSEMDLILLPYETPFYAQSTSGVFAEALAAGKPVVVPAPTWMSDELKTLGAGVTYPLGDLEQLHQALCRGLDDFEALALKASRDQERALKAYSAENLVARLLRATTN